MTHRSPHTKNVLLSFHDLRFWCWYTIEAIQPLATFTHFSIHLSLTWFAYNFHQRNLFLSLGAKVIYFFFVFFAKRSLDCRMVLFCSEDLHSVPFRSVCVSFVVHNVCYCTVISNQQIFIFPNERQTWCQQLCLMTNETIHQREQTQPDQLNKIKKKKTTTTERNEKSFSLGYNYTKKCVCVSVWFGIWLSSLSVLHLLLSRSLCHFSLYSQFIQQTFKDAEKDNNRTVSYIFVFFLFPFLVPPSAFSCISIL